MTLQVTEQRSGYLSFESHGERNKLWAFSALLSFAMALAALGSGLHRWTYRETLTCERAGGQGACEIRRKSLFRDDSKSVGLESIADLEYDTDADTPTLRVLSEGTNLALPLEADGPSRPAADQRLQEFLADDTASELTLRRNYIPEVGGPLFGFLLFGAGGGAALWMMSWTSLELTRRSFDLHRQRLFGEKRFEYPIEAIEGLEIESVEQSTRRGQTMKHRVIAHMDDGESIPLTYYRMASEEPAEQTRDEIEAFLRQHGQS
jgi:hypothetical protein